MRAFGYLCAAMIACGIIAAFFYALQRDMLQHMTEFSRGSWTGGVQAFAIMGLVHHWGRK